jgi:hypothetical protein
MGSRLYLAFILEIEQKKHLVLNFPNKSKKKMELGANGRVLLPEGPFAVKTSGHQIMFTPPYFLVFRAYSRKEIIRWSCSSHNL